MSETNATPTYPSVSDLTLEEKASLTSGGDAWHLQGVEHKGIPGYMITDGPHGLRKSLASNTSETDLNDSVPATCFPPAAGLSSSWNPALIRKVGEAMGEECVQEKVAVILGPGVNIKRNPLGGRCFEYWSEDPYLAGHEAVGIVEGVQSKGVGTSLKHFAANNQETDRLRVDARISQRALREIYLPAFEHIVKTAQPWTIMCSYNKINGVHSARTIGCSPTCCAASGDSRASSCPTGVPTTTAWPRSTPGSTSKCRRATPTSRSSTPRATAASTPRSSTAWPKA